jgi:cell wall-associated NlpC family hydrolase
LRRYGFAVTSGRRIRQALLATAVVAGAAGGTAAVVRSRRRAGPALPPAPSQPRPRATLRLGAAAPMLLTATPAMPSWQSTRQYLYDCDADAAAPRPMQAAVSPLVTRGLRRRLVSAATKAGCGAVTLAAVVVLPTGSGVQGLEQPSWPALAVTGSGPPVRVLGVPSGESSVPGVRLVAQSTVVTALPQPAPLYGGSSLPAIPATVLAAYQTAAAAADRDAPGCNLSWSVLAGIGRIESGHAATSGAGTAGWSGVAEPGIVGPVLDGGTGVALVADTDDGRLDGDPRYDRAVGPMQFLPATWAAYGADGDGDGVRNPQDIWDAALAAGSYLCDGGSNLEDPTQLSTTLLRYNPATWYVRAVLASSAGYLAASYGASQSAYAYSALAFAYARLGDPYAWGGNGPLYDCSGLVQAAFGSAGISLPRTAEQQWQQIPHIDPAQLLPGDLVFFDAGEFVPGLPGHVGVYAGAGMMIDDPHTGSFVRIEPVAGFGSMVGAARPTLLIPPVGAAAPTIGFPLTQSPSVPAPAVPTGAPRVSPVSAPQPSPAGAASPSASSMPDPSPILTPSASDEPTPSTPAAPLPAPDITAPTDTYVDAPASPTATPTEPAQQPTPELTVGPSDEPASPAVSD